MNQHIYDFVVVGAGTMGRSAALYLTLQYPDSRCALIEQFKFGHTDGSSHSRIRIIRSTYIHPFYRDLCLQGIDKNWPEIEELLKAKFIVNNPFLAFIEDEDTFKQYLEVADSSTNIKKLSLQEVRKMFPSAPHVQMAKPVFYDTKAGIIMAENYMSMVLKYLKTQKNLDIFQETEVVSIKNNANGVTLQLKKENQVKKIFAKKVSLNCGKWIGKLVPSVRSILKEVRQTTTYWRMKDPEKYKLGINPAWNHHLHHQDLYALPDASGDGIKYGIHYQDPEEEKKFKSEEQFLEAKIEETKKRMEEHYKGEYEGMIKVQKCYYTVTKSEDFLIDWTDEYENVLICSPCSGHGFKFSPVIGQIVADLLKKNESTQLFEKYRYLMRLHYHKGINLE